MLAVLTTLIDQLCSTMNNKVSKAWWNKKWMLYKSTESADYIDECSDQSSNNPYCCVFEPKNALTSR